VGVLKALLFLSLCKGVLKTPTFAIASFTSDADYNQPLYFSLIPGALLMLTQLPLFPAHSALFAVPPQMPQPVEVKERMPIHIVTWKCPDTGRNWERIFPQTQAMKDWKGERNLFRCLKNLDIRGTSYTIQTIDRTAFIWS
jgi:hypothetical protein